MEQFLKDAKDASGIVSTLSGAVKNSVLNKMADALIEYIVFIAGTFASIVSIIEIRYDFPTLSIEEPIRANNIIVIVNIPNVYIVLFV